MIKCESCSRNLTKLTRSKREQHRRNCVKNNGHFTKRLLSNVSDTIEDDCGARTSNKASSICKMEPQEPILTYLDYKYVLDKDRSSDKQYWRYLEY